MTKLRLLAVEAGSSRELPGRGALPPQAHVFEKDSIDAVNAALAARRPLLVRGEPGTGKSQLAYAAAVALERAYVTEAVDRRTEPRDLKWRFDAVARLAEAQIQAVLGGDGDGVRERLAERLFVHPGALWWAFDWPSALAQAKAVGAEPPPVAPGCDPANGAVVLVDEIDKADASVPNGLLEAFGEGRFKPPGCPEVVLDAERPPLVVITTNEERALPDAFLRRCLVLHLELPSGESALVEHLVGRGRVHFPGTAPEVLEKAAQLLVRDRLAVLGSGLAPPGQAEYLDLLRAVLGQTAGKGKVKEKQLSLLDTLARFTFRKHPPDRSA
jgi:MoxR-like ATPase